ncbi:MAG TPA: tetratricopeptide repeat protein [Chitinophagaceae bacterium]|nr:tetratricopeptide repeat protein [Chitinophagaceae bacterium]
MSEFDIHDTLVRYLDGDMDAAEKVDIEKRLEADPALREQLEELKLAIHAVKFGGLSEKVKGIHKEMSTKRLAVKPGAGRTVRMFSRRTMSLAASIVIGLAMLGGWWVYKMQADQIFEDHYVEFSVTQARGDGKPSGISGQYNQKNYAELIRNAGRKDLGSQDSLIIALSFLHEKQYDKAEAWLTAIQQQSTTHRDDADYYLAFTWLAQKQYEKSYELFKAIHDDPGHLYHSAVTELLLNKIAFKNL